VKRSLPLNSIKYIAVSHVWGQATWQRVAGHEEKVLVSNEKAKFLAERLPSVVGDQYFWMDILCVNQRDSTERVAVTQHIPSIFRLAERTIVVRDSTGFQSCYAAVIGDVTWLAGPNTSEEACKEYWGFVQHCASVHKGIGFNEGALTRLWPLQEMMLSDKLEFVRCEATEVVSEDESEYVSIGDILISIKKLAFLWSMFGESVTVGEFERRASTKIGFLNAFLNCKTVTRPVPDTSEIAGPNLRDGFHLSNSGRVTTKARDFILATMPQYSFYTVPKNAKEMTFKDLWIDCCNQLAANRQYWFRPFFIDRFDIRDQDGIAMFGMDIPEPTRLGDLVKLFNGPTLPPPGPQRQFVNIPVRMVFNPGQLCESIEGWITHQSNRPVAQRMGVIAVFLQCHSRLEAHVVRCHCRNGVGVGSNQASKRSQKSSTPISSLSASIPYQVL